MLSTLPDNLERLIKRFLVTSVQSCFYEIAISKFIKETKMVRNLFHVISVQSHLHKIGILKVIEKSTMARNIFHVISVQSHFHEIAK